MHPRSECRTAAPKKHNTKSGANRLSTHKHTGAIVARVGIKMTARVCVEYIQVRIFENN